MSIPNNPFENPFDRWIDELAERVAGVVVERLRGGEPGMIDQGASPLGRRKHCAAVRRRVARCEPGAAVVGRKHLLSPDALAEELGRANKKQPTGELTSAQALRADIEHQLRLVRRGEKG